MDLRQNYVSHLLGWHPLDQKTFLCSNPSVLVRWLPCTLGTQTWVQQASYGALYRSHTCPKCLLTLGWALGRPRGIKCIPSRFPAQETRQLTWLGLIEFTWAFMFSQTCFLFIYVFIYFAFPGPHMWHMEVPRLVIKSEL